MIEIAHLLVLADAYISETSVKETTLSHRIFGDSKKLTAIRNGSDITVGRFNAAVHWFSENWPVDTQWPSNVVRPMPEAA